MGYMNHLNHINTYRNFHYLLLKIGYGTARAYTSRGEKNSNPVAVRFKRKISVENFQSSNIIQLLPFTIKYYYLFASFSTTLTFMQSLHTSL